MVYHISHTYISYIKWHVRTNPKGSPAVWTNTAFGLEQQAHPVELGGDVNTTCLFTRSASYDTTACQTQFMVGLGHLSKKVHASSGVDLEEWSQLKQWSCSANPFVAKWLLAWPLSGAMRCIVANSSSERIWPSNSWRHNILLPSPAFISSCLFAVFFVVWNANEQQRPRWLWRFAWLLARGMHGGVACKMQCTWMKICHCRNRKLGGIHNSQQRFQYQTSSFPFSIFTNPIPIVAFALNATLCFTCSSGYHDCCHEKGKGRT